MKKILRAAVLLAAASFAVAPATGCAADTEEDAFEDEAQLATQLSATSIKTAAGYNAFATDGGGFGQAGKSMKFLVDNRDPKKPSIFFVNGNFKENGKTPEFAKFHFFFARKKLGIAEDNKTFNDSTYFVQDKRFFAGTIQTYKLGDDKDVTYAVQLYPDDVAKEQTILQLLRIVKPAFTIKNAKLAFVAGGTQQTTATVKDPIKALGFDVMSIDQVMGSIKFLPMNPGEAFGFLRIFPKDVTALRPTDVPVFAELPLDLSVVAGTVTKQVQDVNSHVNLKAKQRGTPNMVLRDASPTNADLAPFADKPVHLVVTKSQFKIEPTTEEIVAQKLKERMSRPLMKLPVVAESRLLSYDEMCPKLTPACHEGAARWGAKATELGFLASPSVMGRVTQAGSMSREVGYDITPKGFGIPVQFYRDFVDAPENAALKTKINQLIAKENEGNLSPAERLALVKEVQALFYKGTLPKDEIAAVRTRIGQILPGIEELKIRSSSNAEDIPNFDGAGLHDSFSAEPDNANLPDGSCNVIDDGDGVVTKLKVKPKTVECAIKATYASLWNQRAIEERSFARLDHATSGMGISVVPAHDTEADVAANSVVITRGVNTDDIIAYSLSIQKDNNLVTNPDPGTISESTLAIFGDQTRPPRFTTARFATPKAGSPALTSPVLTQEQMTLMTKIAQQVELQYCRSKPDYYNGDCRFVFLDPEKPGALDMEFKFLANGHFLLKQSREFSGR